MFVIFIRAEVVNERRIAFAKESTCQSKESLQREQYAPSSYTVQVPMNPTNISVTAKFISKYVLRLRRLQFLMKATIVAVLSVTMVTHKVT